MGLGTDVVKARDWRAVVDRAAERAPEEELVDAAEPAIGIATDEIDVERFEIGGRIRFARHDPVVEIIDVRSEDRLDAVGVFFAQLLGPTSIRRRRDLAGRVALDDGRPGATGSSVTASDPARWLAEASAALRLFADTPSGRRG